MVNSEFELQSLCRNETMRCTCYFGKSVLGKVNNEMHLFEDKRDFLNLNSYRVEAFFVHCCNYCYLCCVQYWKRKHFNQTKSDIIMHGFYLSWVLTDWFMKQQLLLSWKASSAASGRGFLDPPKNCAFDPELAGFISVC